MSDAVTERRVHKDSFDLQAEIEHLKTICGDDPELLADMIEGETDLEGFVGKMLRLIGEDAAAQKALGDYARTIADRKKRLDNREKRLRVLLGTVISQLPDRKFRHPLATIGVSDVDPKPIIEDESKIPSDLWKRPEPQLDMTALRARLLGRKKALEELLQCRTEEERAARRKEIDEEFPDVPGASLDNGDITVSIRRT